ncbi:uncharacterized protein LOC106866313 [Brachypodium distachyon]|uniref:uncharacterized protein LOC106866313 n=1 Tax=Brachypodium distachyon TaxID=15368 RepID=UPI00071D23CF|nr:uncharacterized protein LOC106866313 [Brachypodium distachyon]|eukprot:XP_014755657.1 uncharacterized protein LOC106866313 [Brachypodium distachyon]
MKSTGGGYHRGPPGSHRVWRERVPRAPPAPRFPGAVPRVPRQCPPTARSSAAIALSRESGGGASSRRTRATTARHLPPASTGARVRLRRRQRPRSPPAHLSSHGTVAAGRLVASGARESPARLRPRRAPRHHITTTRTRLRHRHARRNRTTRPRRLVRRRRGGLERGGAILAPPLPAAFGCRRYRLVMTTPTSLRRRFVTCLCVRRATLRLLLGEMAPATPTPRRDFLRSATLVFLFKMKTALRRRRGGSRPALPSTTGSCSSSSSSSSRCSRSQTSPCGL